MTKEELIAMLEQILATTKMHSFIISNLQREIEKQIRNRSYHLTVLDIQRGYWLAEDNIKNIMEDLKK